jgi:hypothetical protein
MEITKDNVIKKYSDICYLCGGEDGLKFFIKSTDDFVRDKYENINDLLSYELSSRYKLIENNQSKKMIWNVFKLNSVDEDHRNLFAEIAEKIFDSSEGKAVSPLTFVKYIHGYINLFNKKSKNVSSEIGLFGELLIIYKLKTFIQKQFDLLKFYQRKQGMPCDFAIKEQYYDAKSTTRFDKKISLTKSQIKSKPNIIKVDLFESQSGVNIYDLSQMMANIGLDLNSVGLKDSLKKYSNSELRFDVDLCDISVYNSEDIFTFNNSFVDNDNIEEVSITVSLKGLSSTSEYEFYEIIKEEL